MAGYAAYNSIITTTIENRSGKLADNVSKGNALLAQLKEKGAWKSATGRVIVQEVDYLEGRFQWYSGYDTFDVTPADVFTAFEYPWAQAAGIVTANGLEIDVQNQGKEAIIDLFESRITNAERTMRNQVTYGMYSNGTAYGGKIITGLQALVSALPTSGTVGGVDRNLAGNVWARNQYYRPTADGGAAASATNIQSYMNILNLRCRRGPDQPNLAIADTNYYRFFWTSLQAMQRILDEKTGSLGFKTLDYAGMPVVYEDNPGMPASTMYMLNTDYLFMRYAPKRNFKPLGMQHSFNQDAVVEMILFAGQLTCSNFALQGTLTAT